MLQEELSGKIVGAAMAVLNALRPGLDEKLYERALSLELRTGDTWFQCSARSQFGIAEN